MYNTYLNGLVSLFMFKTYHICLICISICSNIHVCLFTKYNLTFHFSLHFKFWEPSLACIWIHTQCFGDSKICILSFVLMSRLFIHITLLALYPYSAHATGHVSHNLKYESSYSTQIKCHQHIQNLQIPPSI